MNPQKLTVGLPVMIHNVEEINAFLAAKERLESSRDYGIPLDVAAFLFLHPRFALTDENKVKALENQQKYRLPIIQIETPLQGRNSLVYDLKDQERFGEVSQLEMVVELASKLKESDKSAHGLTIDTHVGILVSENLESANPFAGVYSVNGFNDNKPELFERVRTRFGQLAEKAKKNGHVMVLETVPYVTFEKKPFGPVTQHWYYPLSEMEDLEHISQGNITFDAAHLSKSRVLPQLVQRANALNVERTIFELYGLSSWDEYMLKIPSIDRSLQNARAVHLGNSAGIDQRGFGSDSVWSGEGPGLLTKDELGRIVRSAHVRKIPVIVEADYDIKNLSQKQFREADDLLKYALVS